jgi:hypothetical protein
VQDDLLAKYRDRDLAVLVVWLSMLRTDDRSEWPRDEIVDRRAMHYWDRDKVVGTVLAMREDLKAWRPVAYDIWAMFPPGITWSADAPRPVASGRTIIGTRDRLAAAVAALPVARAR